MGQNHDQPGPTRQVDGTSPREHATTSARRYVSTPARQYVSTPGAGEGRVPLRGSVTGWPIRRLRDSKYPPP